MKSHRKPDVNKKPPSLPTHMETPQESPLLDDSPQGGESPPEFGTESLNHYDDDDDEDDDSEDDDMDEEEDEREEEEDSSSEQSGSRSESSSGSESESENSEADLMTM